MNERNAAIVTDGSGTELRFAYRELLTPGMMALTAGIACALVPLIVAAGPLGTSHTLSLGGRLAFWGLVGVLDLPICYSMGVLMLYLVRDRTGHQAALALAAAAIIVAAPCSAITFSVYGLFHEVPSPTDLADIYVVNALNLLSASALIYYVICLRLRHTRPVSTEGTTSERGFPQPIPATTVPTPAADDVLAAQLAAAGAEAGRSAVRADRNGEPAGVTSDQTTADLFFGRLSPEVGRDVVYLKMSGHYLEVVTTVASATILMRFADAIANLGDSGMRVHRSYWVAHHHVTGILRRDRRDLLRLTGNHEVPVSRTYLPAVRAAVNGAYGHTAAPASAR